MATTLHQSAASVRLDSAGAADIQRLEARVAAAPKILFFVLWVIFAWGSWTQGPQPYRGMDFLIPAAVSVFAGALFLLRMRRWIPLTISFVTGVVAETLPPPVHTLQFTNVSLIFAVMAGVALPLPRAAAALALWIAITIAVAALRLEPTDIWWSVDDILLTASIGMTVAIFVRLTRLGSAKLSSLLSTTRMRELLHTSRSIETTALRQARDLVMDRGMPLMKRLSSGQPMSSEAILSAATALRAGPWLDVGDELPEPRTLGSAATQRAIHTPIIHYPWSAYLVFLPAVSFGCWAVLSHWWRDPTYAPQVGLLVLTVAIALFSIRIARLDPQGNLKVLTLAVLQGVIAWTQLALAGPGALVNSNSWSLNVAPIAVVVLAMYVPTWVALLLPMPTVMAILLTLGADPTLRVTDVQSAFVGAIGPMVFGLGVAELWRHTHRAWLRDLEHSHVLVRQADIHRARERAEELFLNDARRVVVPWLETLAVSGPTPRTQQQARAHLWRMEDELRLPGLLDEALRQRLAQARAKACQIKFLGSAQPHTASAVELLRILDRALDQLEPLDCLRLWMPPTAVEAAWIRLEPETPRTQALVAELCSLARGVRLHPAEPIRTVDLRRQPTVRVMSPDNKRTPTAMATASTSDTSNEGWESHPKGVTS